MRADSGILMIVSWFAISWLADLGRVISPVEAGGQPLRWQLHSIQWFLAFVSLDFPPRAVCNGTDMDPWHFQWKMQCIPREGLVGETVTLVFNNCDAL